MPLIAPISRLICTWGEVSGLAAIGSLYSDSVSFISVKASPFDIYRSRRSTTNAPRSPHSPRFHARGAVGRHRDHRASDRHPLAGALQGAGTVQCSEVRLSDARHRATALYVRP